MAKDDSLIAGSITLTQLEIDTLTNLLYEYASDLFTTDCTDDELLVLKKLNFEFADTGL